MKSPKKLEVIPGKPWLEILLLIINDLVGFTVAIGGVTLVRNFIMGTDTKNLFDPQAIRTIVYLVVFSFVMLALRGLYPGYGRPSVVELRQVFEAVALAYAIVGVFIFIQREGLSFSRSVFILSGFFAVGCISIGRFLVRKRIAKYRWWGEPVVIVGLESEIIQVTEKLLTCARLGLRPVIGLAVDTDKSIKKSKIPIKPWSSEIQKEVHNSRIMTNILAISTSDLRQNYPLVYKSVGLSFQKTIFIIDNDIFGSMMAQPLDINGQPAIISQQSLLNPILRFVKFIFEFVSCLLIFIPLIILSLVLAVLIKIDSPGGVLYTQARIGRHKKPFQLIKFRTMVNNSQEVLEEMLKDPEIKRQWKKYHKIENDRRITRIGKWIRKFSLDELPQLINILRGEMSLIGPRPYMQSEIDEVGEAADLIFAVRPGLTGWWQVNGRNDLSFDERTQLDLFYVYNWSLWLDLFIFIKTFWVMIFDRSGK